ncbi:DegQ family serine endoprotease [Candidatus Moduliflexota bacterium]
MTALTNKKKEIFVALLGIALILIGFSCGREKPTGDSALQLKTSGATRFSVPAVFAADGETSLADVAESRIKGVVNISSTKIIRSREGSQNSPFFNDPFFEHFFGRRFRPRIPRERRERSLGSGVIVDADGVILTNNHVVENAEDITVTLADGRDFKAEIIGTDPKSDVAVILLKEKPEGLEPIPIGDSGELRLGDVVLAIGNPFGLSHTVTMGIVSAKGRANVGVADYEDFIQTDAAINPGNSGGALINLKGELIGINTAIFSRSGGYQGIGFAIPSLMAKSIMNSLLKHGKVVRGWLGVSIQDIDRNLADAMDLPSVSGVLVSDVTEDSPASKAGVRRGDVIMEVNGSEVNSPDRLRNLIATMGAEAEVVLTVFRDGETQKITVDLEGIPEDLSRFGAVETKKGILGGMTVAPLSSPAGETFDIPKEIRHGVIVTEVEQGSTAERAGLVPGSVIMEINRQKIDSVETFTRIYRKSKNNLLLLVYREGSTLFLVLRK